MTLSVVSNANGSGGSLKIGAQDRLVLNSDGTLSGVTNPVQFDRTLKLATTGFVQQALGNHQGIIGCVQNTTISPVAAGSAIMLLGLTAYTVQFPSPADMPQGARFKAICTNPAGVTITCARPNSFMSPNGNYADTFIVGMGDVIEFIKLDLTWTINGTATTFTSPQFKAQLTQNGWQRLPSGLILQWGAIFTATDSIITYPIVFPTGALQISGSAYQTATGPSEAVTCSFRELLRATAIAQPRTITNLGVSTQQTTVFWLAIGY